MASNSYHELAQFHQFVAETLAVGAEQLTPEEVLDLWREAHPAESDHDDSVAAIQESLDDLSRGERGVPLDEFDRAFRSRVGLPARP